MFLFYKATIPFTQSFSAQKLSLISAPSFPCISSVIRSYFRTYVPLLIQQAKHTFWDFTHFNSMLQCQLLWMATTSSMQLRATHIIHTYATNKKLFFLQKLKNKLKFKENLGLKLCDIHAGGFIFYTLSSLIKGGNGSFFFSWIWHDSGQAAIKDFSLQFFEFVLLLNQWYGHTVWLFVCLFGGAWTSNVFRTINLRL